MKRQLFFIILIGILSAIFFACEENTSEKNNNLKSSKSDGEVELYLIDSYSTINNTSQIDETTLITKSSPLVTYSDILSYDPGSFTFEISKSAKEAIKSLNHSVRGIAFALKANNSLIYSGYFWPGYSSISCDWVVIDPNMLSIGNTIKVDLGYPGSVKGHVIPDKRNDKRILDILDSDNKLIK